VRTTGEGRMEEQRYSTIGRFRLTLNVLIPVLIVVILVLAHTIMWSGGHRTAPPLWWSAFIGSFGLFYGVRTAFLAHTVRVGRDGRVEFRRLLNSVTVTPPEVGCVRRSVLPPFLSVVCSRGYVLLPNKWRGLDEVIEHLRRGNPGLRLKGI
jgi:hypothetical protein